TQHLEASDSDIGTRLDVLHQHEFIVHLVNMIAGENDDELRCVALDDVYILCHRVRSTEVPFILGDTLRGWQDVEALIPLGPQEIPTLLHMSDQTVRLVLRRDTNASYSGIERIG